MKAPYATHQLKNPFFNFCILLYELKKTNYGIIASLESKSLVIYVSR